MRTYLRKALLSAIGVGMAMPAFADEEGSVRNPAADWDILWVDIVNSITFIGVVFSIAAIWMLFKYRAKSEDEVGKAPKLSKAAALGWVLIPASLFMAEDFYLSAKGWVLWNDYRRIPDEAQEIRVTAYQWYWEFDYGDDIVSEELVLPQGKPVVLRMTSEDVLHSFYIPEYRVKEDVMPGRVTYVWFNPVNKGEHIYTCTEYCGTAHAEMAANVRIVDQEEYDAWFAQTKEEAKAASVQSNTQG